MNLSKMAYTGQIFKSRYLKNQTFYGKAVKTFTDHLRKFFQTIKLSFYYKCPLNKLNYNTNSKGDFSM